MGSRLESLGISTDFAAGVLVARQLEGGIRFGLGSTLALRRRDLEAIGGFRGFLDYLADDYQIGSHLVQRGFRVELSDVVVQTFLPAYTLRQFADHQLRWGRTIRDSRRRGYLGLVLTFGLPWSVLALLFSGGAFWAWALLAIATLLRIDVAVIVGWLALRDQWALTLLPLLPVRDSVAFLLWMISLTGDTVVWRGSSFRLKEGKLNRLDSS
jgi:ceramide glucosyltransferase